jgi:hypothetical protein
VAQLMPISLLSAIVLQDFPFFGPVTSEKVAKIPEPPEFGIVSVVRRLVVGGWTPGPPNTIVVKKPGSENESQSWIKKK